MIVLDTHALLWMDRDDASLGAAARDRIEREWRTGTVAVSAISFWECAMLAQHGRISLHRSADAWRAELLEAGLTELPVDGRVGLLAASLEGLHRDPADRFIVATALLKEATLVTADQAMLDWQSGLSRLDARR